MEIPEGVNPLAKVVIIGGGWSGCGSDNSEKAGAEVVILENRSAAWFGQCRGIMRNNGRFTAAEELIALGAGELIAITDQATRHKNVNFPGHKHAYLYDVTKVEPLVRQKLSEMGITIKLETRAINVNKEDKTLKISS